MQIVECLLRHTVVHGLEVVDERKDVPVAHRHPLQHSDLISDLVGVSLDSLRGVRW